MGKLYFDGYDLSKKGKEILDRTIVDILTTNKARTSVYAPKEDGRIIPDIIALNSVSQGAPLKLWFGFYERGFVNPKNDEVLYLIDAERKIIGIRPNNINLFLDADKADVLKGRFVWDGTIPEIIEQFKKAGYELVNI